MLNLSRDIVFDPNSHLELVLPQIVEAITRNKVQGIIVVDKFGYRGVLFGDQVLELEDFKEQSDKRN